MITDHAIDQALIELKRTEYQLLALRAERRATAKHEATQGKRCWPAPSVKHAAAKRATLDLTRKLADLRAGR